MAEKLKCNDPDHLAEVEKFVQGATITETAVRIITLEDGVHSFKYSTNVALEKIVLMRASIESAMSDVRTGDTESAVKALAYAYADLVILHAACRGVVPA